MQIDWVAVVAQIVNFLILVWLLKRFLYGPILRVMEERQERISREMDEAGEREAAAKEEERRHREARRELDEQRDEMLDEAREEAEATRRQLVEQARHEVQDLERRWHESLREEQDAFVRELRERMGRQVCSVARRALEDIANQELQAQVLSVFTQRLRELDDERRDELRAALADDDRAPRITSAFALTSAQRNELQAAAREALEEDLQLSFEESDELLCGIELAVGGLKIAWSIDSYLDALEHSVVGAIERETASEGRERDAQAAEAPSVDDVMPPSEVMPPEGEDRE